MRTRIAFFLAATYLHAAPNPIAPHQYHQKDYDLYNLQLLENEELYKRFQTNQTMTGDWGGARSALEKRGITISSSYVTDILGNPTGGKTQAFAYAGSLGAAINFDFERAAGWRGFQLYSSAAWRSGSNLSTRIGNAFNAAQVYGTQTVVLNELYFKQSLCGSNLIFKAGRLNACNDFMTSPLYAEFVSFAFSANPAAVFYNFPSFSVYPNATWGVYLAIHPIPQLLAKLGVYNANFQIFQNKYHGVNFTFSNTNGVIWVTEWAYLRNQEKESIGLPGNYKIGALYQTGSTPYFKQDLVQSNYSIYLALDQMVYRQGNPKFGRGCTPFAIFLFAPQDRNIFPFFFSTGFVWAGILDGRPWDTTNFALAYGNYSSDLAAMQRLGFFGGAPQNYEIILEANHWFQVNNWVTFTPDIQYIINPNGYGTIPNALVVGAQIGIIL